MDVLDFIENDLKKERGSLGWRVLFSALFFVLPIVLGIGMRDSYSEAFGLRVFLPNLVAAFLLGCIPFLYRKRNDPAFGSRRWIFGFLAISLFLAIERVFFPPGLRTAYPSFEALWDESAKCFIKGSIAVIASGVALFLIAFRFSAWPSMQSRVLLSMAAGFSGAVMLGFHCDSSSVAHVLSSHIGPGILFGLIFFGIQNFLFNSRLKGEFPKMKQSIQNMDRLG